MGKERKRTITPADKAAARRLRAIWDAIPKGERPTQAELAMDFPGEAPNQSLISQYLGGKIALNYKAVRYFATALNVPESAIRTDLPEQTLNHSALNRGTEKNSEAGVTSESQLLQISVPILHEAMTLLGHEEDQVGELIRPALARTERLAELYRRVAADGGRLSADGYRQLGEEIETRRGKHERAKGKRRPAG
jgi:hypothetical protein